MAKITHDETSIRCFEEDIDMLHWDDEDREIVAIGFADMVEFFLESSSDPKKNYDDEHDAAYFAVMDGTLSTSSEAICWARNRYGYKD